jgi:serine/threonine-protein kinase
MHLLDQPQAGRVYDARRPGVLLKVVRPELVREPGTCDRLVRELRRIQALEHPGLVPLVDVQLFERQKTVILIDSSTTSPSHRVLRFRTVFGTEAFGIQETHKVMMELAAVLGYLHERGVCHGDVRPQTLLRAQPGNGLRDLGLATSLPRADYLNAIKWHDEPSLLAPEVRDGLEPDSRADVFAVAAMYQDILVSACHQEGTTPQRMYPALTQVLNRSLHNDPAQRYQSGAALYSALAAALTGWGRIR